MKPCVVVLAAGQGARYRAVAGDRVDKLLVPCKGLDAVVRPMLEQVLRACDGIGAERLLITRPGKPAIEALARQYGFDLQTLDSAGLGDSLAAGVRERIHANGWLVVLGDMPLVQPATLAKVAAAMAPTMIAAPVGAQGYGHPVGFGRAWGGGLASLKGDQGARRLFRSSVVIDVPVDDPGIYLDVDVPTV